MGFDVDLIVVMTSVLSASKPNWLQARVDDDSLRRGLDDIFRDSDSSVSSLSLMATFATSVTRWVERLFGRVSVGRGLFGQDGIAIATPAAAGHAGVRQAISQTSTLTGRSSSSRFFRGVFTDESIGRTRPFRRTALLSWLQFHPRRLRRAQPPRPSPPPPRRRLAGGRYCTDAPPPPPPRRRRRSRSGFRRTKEDWQSSNPSKKFGRRNDPGFLSLALLNLGLDSAALGAMRRRRAYHSATQFLIALTGTTTSET